MKITIITSVAELNIRTQTVKKTMKELEHEIHTIAVSSLYHVENSGDATTLTNTLNALGSSARKKAFIVWAESHAPVVFRKKDKTFGMRKKWKEKTFDIEGSMTKTYWEFSKEIDPKEYDLMKDAIATLKRIEKNEADLEAFIQILKGNNPIDAIV